MTDSKTVLERWIRFLRAQIAVAERAEVEESDLCIATYPGYLALQAGFPVIELDSSPVAVVTKGWAKGVIDMAVGEMGGEI